jgi:hypothetical protein
MIGQGLRNNWGDEYTLLSKPERGRVGNRPHRECWRWWPHNHHLHMGPDGSDPMARCPGRRVKRDVTLTR